MSNLFVRVAADKKLLRVEFAAVGASVIQFEDECSSGSWLVHFNQPTRRIRWNSREEARQQVLVVAPHDVIQEVSVSVERPKITASDM